jgi:YidC/Oxa1 family membrane protein insertase
MNLDIIARPLGQFLLFIYNTVAFHNYGLAIIFFTIIVRLALLPLTLKQYKSSAKMQELQPIIADIQKRYKDDKEKLNQEMMKVYKDNNYNPASGCLPLLIQMPILITLYYVIVEPLKFMLAKDANTITALVEVAAKGLGKTVQAMGFQKELLTLNYFNENREAMSQVADKLKTSELVDFNNFIGLHLGETASFHTDKLFGPQAGIYLPLLLLAIIAVVTTFISSKLAMPGKNNQNSGQQQNAMANSMTNSMLYIGPLMTLMFSFQLPAGVVLYWMIGYVVAIGQQLYINRYVLKKHLTPEQRALEAKKIIIPGKQLEAGDKPQESGNSLTGENKQAGGKPLNAGNKQPNTESKKPNTENKKPNAGGSKKSGSGSGKKGNNNKKTGLK